MFVCTYSAMRSLLQFLSKNKCDSCYMCSKPWNLEKGSAQQTGHAVGYAVKRSNGHRLKWLSSPIVNGKYYVNCRYLHIPIFIGTSPFGIFIKIFPPPWKSDINLSLSWKFPVVLIPFPGNPKQTQPPSPGNSKVQWPLLKIPRSPKRGGVHITIGIAHCIL